MVFKVPTQGVEYCSYYTHSTGSKSISHNRECAANPHGNVRQGVCGNYIQERWRQILLLENRQFQIFRRSREVKKDTRKEEKTSRLGQSYTDVKKVKRIKQKKRVTSNFETSFHKGNLLMFLPAPSLLLSVGRELSERLSVSLIITEIILHL